MTDIVLSFVIPGVLLIALTVDVAVLLGKIPQLLGWLRAWNCGDHDRLGSVGRANAADDES